MLVVVAMIATISAVSMPLAQNLLAHLHLSGDARSAANALTLAKMRAAATFTQARLYVDLSARTFRVETWRKTGVAAWVTDGGTTTLSANTQFGFGGVTTPPPNSQVAIGQPSACRDAAGAAVANTACIVFNSRGVPIVAKTTGPPDGTEVPLATNALYMTDDATLYGSTVSAAGAVRVWRTQTTGAVNWAMQ
jgi:Tfp pilus assembly protein FimT